MFGKMNSEEAEKARATKQAKKEAARAEEKKHEEEEKLLEKKRDLVYKDTIAYEKAHRQEAKAAPKDSFISLQHINKIYGNHVQAVYDFNLEIKQHEFIVLVGPSGCGKSTTLRMIAGLESITSGDLYIDGNYSNDLEPKDRNLAMVFQNYALYPHMSVYSNMAFGLKMRKIPKEEVDQRVHNAAKILQLEDYLDRKPGELSGGQCQRVALGRAIVRDCRVFLMDEPLSNLDAKLRVQMRSEIVALHDSIGATTVYVTHDQTEAMTMASRIVVMKLGRVQQIGTPKEVYNYPANVFVATFIGSPAMNIFSGEYDNGKVTLKNGFAVALPAAFSKGHDAFYQNELKLIAERKKELNAELAKPNLAASLSELDKQELDRLGKQTAEFEGILKTKKHPIYFGIRPEDLHQAGVPSDAVHVSDPMSIDVVSAEFLGKEYFIHSAIAEDHLIAKIGAVRDVKAHEKISLLVDIDKIHLFDVFTSKYIPLS